MNRARWLFLLPALLCCCEAAPSGEATVEAIRFRQLISEGAMDYVHGGGSWHDCLFLPEAGVVAQVVWESDWTSPTFAEQARMHAYRSTLEAARTRPQDGKPSLEAQREPESIRIPRELADRIIGLADQTAQVRSLGLQLAAECIGSHAIGDRSSAGNRDF